jgi:outer membrane biosynthesis protein TonB
MKTVTTQRMVDGRSSHRAATATSIHQVDLRPRQGQIVRALFVALLTIAVATKATAQDGSQLSRSANAASSTQGLTLITLPKPLNLSETSSRIRYPEQKAQAADRVQVDAELYVNREGTVERFVVDGPADAAYKEAVATQVLSLRFEPARAGDRPIAAYVTIPFVFVLR